ncbi:hypothetical protein L6164_018904 [Bauhinia variegata]|uniref:Uncharacterized protein n=1 Tax=Bauhinia variegata TaxID=167791 RepID=A0ACB9NCU9_BAUVA|nr:hypothetical protein L6164_018904 [Bauhinia variegata]
MFETKRTVRVPQGPPMKNRISNKVTHVITEEPNAQMDLSFSFTRDSIVKAVDLVVGEELLRTTSSKLIEQIRSVLG